MELSRKTRRQRPRLDARRRETRRPRRGGLNESWRPRELGARFHSSKPPNGTGTTKGQILIVDDESAIRLVCRLNLSTAGFDTLEASDGASALALARAERPDLILLDIMLPEVDGWGVAEELAADPETRDIPILFLTARSDRTDEVKGHGLGGVGYITKPFDPLELTGTVARVLHRARRGERESIRSEWEQTLRRADG